MAVKKSLSSGLYRLAKATADKASGKKGTKVITLIHAED